MLHLLSLRGMQIQDSFIRFSNLAGGGCGAVQDFDSQNPCIFHGMQIPMIKHVPHS